MNRLIRPLVLGTALGLSIATTSLIHESDLFRNVANVQIDPHGQFDLDRQLRSGDCWQTGSGHGYPTRMWTVEEDAFSAFYVATSDQAVVDLAVASPPSNLVAFCDGVNLTTGKPVN